MKKSILTSVLAAGLAFLAMGAHAQAGESTAPAANQQVPPALQLAVQGGLKVERSFSAAGGLTGWVMSEGPGRNMIVYTSANGEVAIAGNMLDAKGQNLTAKYLDQYAPKPDLNKYWDQLEKTAYVAEGAKGKDVKSVIYVFEDGNCGYCHMMWQAVQPYEKAGLQVRWIPVAFLAPTSANKGAAVLGAKDPAAAMAKLHAEWGDKNSTMATTTVTPELKAKLDANAKLMAELGFRGTPATVYKDKSGKVLTSDGMPRPAALVSMTGITAPADAKSDAK